MFESNREEVEREVNREKEGYDKPDPNFSFGRGGARPQRGFGGAPMGMGGMGMGRGGFMDRGGPMMGGGGPIRGGMG